MQHTDTLYSQPQHIKSSIPQLDFSNDTHHQTIIDREKGQYLGHPDAVLLGDGKTVITVYPKGHAAGELVMKRSTDGGYTWSERLEVPENWSTSISCPTLHRLATPEGGERLVLLTGNESRNEFPVRSAYSDDSGLTWTPLHPIGGPGYSSVVTGSTMVALENGDYMSLQHFHDDDFLQLYKMITSDGGLTWGEPIQITYFDEARLCEPGAIRSPDGKQIAVMIRDNRFDQYKSWVIFSEDEGNSWTQPRLLPPSLTGHRHVARHTPDGRLVVTCRDMSYKSDTYGDWILWVGTYQDIVDCKEGQYRVRLKENKSETRPWDSTYPTLDLLPDGTFLSITYGHWEEGEPPYILGVHFKIEEFDKALNKK